MVYGRRGERVRLYRCRYRSFVSRLGEQLSSDAPRESRRGFSERPFRVLGARQSLAERLAAVWASRELLLYLISSDIKIKYKNSALGMVWSMIAPAMQIGIYFLVFQIILKNGVPDYVVKIGRAHV